MTKLKRTLDAVWYAAGPAQFLLYGMWTIIVSGLFPLDSWWQLAATAWKFNGAAIVVATVWGSLAVKRTTMLLNAFLAIIVGAAFTSKAVMFGDGDVIRAATQSHYMILMLVVLWGFYLANLAERQRMEFKKAGVNE